MADEFTTFRDPEISLWQSAVDEALADAEGGDVPARTGHPLVRATATAAGILKTLRRGGPADASAAAGAGLAEDANDPPRMAALVANLARGFSGDEPAFRALLARTRFTQPGRLFPEHR